MQKILKPGDVMRFPQNYFDDSKRLNPKWPKF